jgi:hypothetical protein
MHGVLIGFFRWPIFLFNFEILKYTYRIHSIHSIILHYILPSPLAEVPLHPLIAAVKLSEKNLSGVPSRESNPGLPLHKPTHYQLSYAAPLCQRFTYILAAVGDCCPREREPGGRVRVPPPQRCPLHGHIRVQQKLPV